MAIAVVKPSRADMERCFVRFDELERQETGFPDMLLPEGKRVLRNVIGNQDSPFDDHAPAAISHLKAGIVVAYISARPGKGVTMHTHDTVETFIAIKGRWKVEWELESGVEGVVLGPQDVIACPVGVLRRFECVEAALGDDEGLLLGINVGDAPTAEGSPEAIQRLLDAGVFTSEQAKAAFDGLRT